MFGKIESVFRKHKERKTEIKLKLEQNNIRKLKYEKDQLRVY